jgi:ribosomal protein S3
MGHLINPTTFRLGISRYWNSRWMIKNFSYNYHFLFKSDWNIQKFIVRLFTNKTCTLAGFVFSHIVFIRTEKILYCLVYFFNGYSLEVLKEDLDYILKLFSKYKILHRLQLSINFFFFKIRHFITFKNFLLSKKKKFSKIFFLIRISCQKFFYLFLIKNFKLIFSILKLNKKIFYSNGTILNKYSFFKNINDIFKFLGFKAKIFIIKFIQFYYKKKIFISKNLIKSYYILFNSQNVFFSKFKLFFQKFKKNFYYLKYFTFTKYSKLNIEYNPLNYIYKIIENFIFNFSSGLHLNYKINLTLRPITRLDYTSSFIGRYLSIRMQQKYSLNQAVKPVLRDLINNPLFVGYKINCLGRFTKKEISAFEKFQKGSIPSNTLMAPVDYIQIPFILKYSMCCFKVWLQFNQTLISRRDKIKFIFRNLLFIEKTKFFFIKSLKSKFLKKKKIILKKNKFFKNYFFFFNYALLKNLSFKQFFFFKLKKSVQHIIYRLFWSKKSIFFNFNKKTCLIKSFKKTNFFNKLMFVTIKKNLLKNKFIFLNKLKKLKIFNNNKTLTKVLKKKFFIKQIIKKFNMKKFLIKFLIYYFIIFFRKKKFFYYHIYSKISKNKNKIL